MKFRDRTAAGQSKIALVSAVLLLRSVSLARPARPGEASWRSAAATTWYFAGAIAALCLFRLAQSVVPLEQGRKCNKGREPSFRNFAGVGEMENGEDDKVSREIKRDTVVQRHTTGCEL